MVRTTSSRKIKPVNKYKKATKKDKHNHIKSIITNGINKDIKEEKNIKIRDSDNYLISKNIDSCDEHTSINQIPTSKEDIVIITPNKTIENNNNETKNLKRNIFLNNEDEKEVDSINDIDDDDGFDFTSSTNKRNEVVLLTNDHIENIEQISFDNDMLLQGRSNIVGSIIKPIPNIKEEGKMSYPCRVYVVSTKANIWIAFSMLY